MVIGYTQGTFDMFHIGHLNILKNARNQCDYLIVGINSDELVKTYKGKDVIVTCSERCEIISSIRYVDEVMVCDTLNKTEIYNLRSFDKLFIGDDWRGSQRWNQTEEDMKKIGVSVVYLPHTNGISSSILREKLTSY